MDRPILYDQASARDYDMLNALRFALYSVAQVTKTLLGSTDTIITNPNAAPTVPASLSINLGAFDIYQQADVDAAAYGSIAADMRQTMQQGFAPSQQITLNTTGLGAGQSRWALIEATFSQVDSIPGDDPNDGVLPYLNVNDPSGPPWAGPSNSGATQNTLRSGVASVRVVYGNIAATGSEVPPNPDTGYVPLYLIDLSFGQTQITSGEILVAGPSVGTGVSGGYPKAPFFTGFSGITGAISSALAGAAGGNGQCLLQFVDATHIQLVPRDGNNIKIAGANYGIPAGGVSITNGGLATGTLYNVYVLNNAGTLQLELSATAPTVDTTAGNIGVLVKTGDTSRSFVGKVKTNGSSQFSSLLTMSWFNAPQSVDLVTNALRNVTGSAPGSTKTASFTFDDDGTSLTLNFDGTTTGLGGMDTGGTPTSGDLNWYLGFVPATLTWGVFGTTACRGPVYTGANTPAGVTATRLISAAVTDGSGNVPQFDQIDRTVTITEQPVMTNNFATVLTLISLGSLIPAAAKTVSGRYGIGAGGSGQCVMNMYADAGGVFKRGEITVTANAASDFSDFPLLTPQEMWFKFTSTTGISSSGISVHSYGV